jgi:hypothetical protein
MTPLDRFRREYCDKYCTDVEPASGRCLLCFIAHLAEVIEDLPSAIATELSEFKIEPLEEEVRIA